MKRSVPVLCLLLTVLLPIGALAAPGIPAMTVETNGQGQSYTLTLQLLALMTAITLLPAALLMMTGFTRIVIVLAILRQALGAGQAPPNQVLIGLSLFLTLFVMGPPATIMTSDNKTWKPSEPKSWRRPNG